MAAVGRISKGDRVCGAVFPYGHGSDTDGEARSGSFAQWLVADARVLLRVPESWSDLEGAALGGIGWGTVGLALSAPDALSLSGLPSQPADVDEKVGDREPVLVYGAATATGTMGCQLLKLWVEPYSFMLSIEILHPAEWLINSLKVWVSPISGDITPICGTGPPVRCCSHCLIHVSHLRR